MPVCVTCAFHCKGVDCPHHHRALPEVYCEVCLSASKDGTMPCPYSLMKQGKLTGTVLLSGFCGLPHIVKSGEFTDTPNEVLAAAMPIKRESKQ